jgi:phage baseplate assembly protein W
MADGSTYGINFPFRDNPLGYYFSLSETTDQEIRSDLLHLILTKKGSRYFLPDFGTRIYEYIFDPFDGETFEAIKSDIQAQVDKFIPNLIINNIKYYDYYN